MPRHRGRKPVLTALLWGLAFALGGCSFGPKALESQHGRYNEAVKQANQQQLLLNLVRLRYNDSLAQLDVNSIATQYEVGGALEARPFFSTEGVNLNPPVGPFGEFSRILPFAGVSATNRPTISLSPLDDPASLRPLFVLGTLDSIIFLAETSWPVSTVFRLYVDFMNRVPNAPVASGPSRGLLPEYRRFLRAMQLLQQLQDSGNIRFVREEKIKEVGGPLPETAVTSSALVEAAKGGYEYRAGPDRTWMLVKRDRKLDLRINPEVVGSPEMLELAALLNLRPGLSQYEVTVGSPAEAFAGPCPSEPATSVNLYPRSTVQALFYLSHGVVVPPEHLLRGIVRPTLGPGGEVFDWREVLGGLFTVYAVKQHCPPKGAHVAVKYHDYWFYIDDRDSDSKATFALMMVMIRLDLLGSKKNGPALTLPVGR